MIWKYWKKFALMEEHALYKVLFYQNQIKMASLGNYSEEDRMIAGKTADKLQLKMYNIETRYKDYFNLVPKY